MTMNAFCSSLGPLLLVLSQAMLLPALTLLAVASASGKQRHIFGSGWVPQPPKPKPQYTWPSKCFTAPQCEINSPYRSFDGSCNNRWVPTFGMANTTLVRLLSARYTDGKGELPASVNGGPLPLARKIRTRLFPDKPISDDVNTMAVMVWGQFLSHDISLINTRPLAQCCNKGRIVTDRQIPTNCLVVEIPEDDEFYSQHSQTCFALSRTETINSKGCVDSPFQQVTQQTGFLDLSMVYGKNKFESDKLRSFVRGRLKTQEDDEGRQFLPNVVNASTSCAFASSPTDTCFLAGDVRVNQQPPLTAMHTVALREHNLLCDQLYLLNPHWDDERLFQEARRILIAQYQHITYAHFVPIILGTENAAYYKLTPTALGYAFGYNEQVNPGTMNMFTTAAFRAFHSIIPSHVEFPMEVGHCPLASKQMSDVFNRPRLVVEDDNLDAIVRGFSRQAALHMDPYFTDQISNMLFRQPTREFGLDLVSIDIMRGRDHGLPSYNSVRNACGLHKASDFHEFENTMSKAAWAQLKEVYEHVDDVDLYVGGIMEDLIPGSLVGRVFQCIIAEQFRRWRGGDRYFYEYGGFPGSFRLDQLDEIKKTSLALLICRNADRIRKVQIDAFSQPSSRNPLIKCKHVPSLNLRLWKESTAEL